MKNKLFLGFGVSLAVLMGAVAPAAAQEEEVGLREIVVTAQRIEVGIQDTPVAVTALDATSLDDQQITTVEEVARAVPGLTLNPVTANPSTFQIGLRGGSEQTGGLIVSEPVVGIYVDDVYRGRLQGSNLQLSDIERIEILRGPQGTLYGRNTFSGAIKVVTRTPSAQNEWLNASIGYGSFSETRADASIGGGLTDTLGGSLAVFYRNQEDGWIFNRARGEDVGAEENFAVRGKLAWDSGPWSVIGAVAYTDDQNDGYIPVNVRFVPDNARVNFATRVRTRDAQPLVGGDPYVTATPIESRGETSVLSASLDIRRDMGDVQFRSITGYVDTDDLFRWDLSGGLEVAPGAFIATFDRLATAEAEQISQELQLSGRAFDDRLQWIAGLYGFYEEGRQDFLDTLGLFGLPTFPLFVQNTETTSLAVFAQGTWALTDRAGLTVGLRYTQDEKSFDATIAAPANVAVSLDETFDSFTPHFGLDYQITPDVLGYVSVSRGFKAGGFNGLSRDPRVLAQSYRPQTVWAYEAGLKGDFLDNTLRANLAVYLNDIEDLQQTATRADGTFPQQNVGDATVWGAELEVFAVPTDGLEVFAAMSYANDEYDTLAPDADAFIANAQNLPLVSEWTARFGATYERMLADVALFRMGGSLDYTGAFDANVTNVLEISDYARASGFVSLATPDERWELSVSGQNLTDETTYVSGIVSAPFPTALTPLRPRTYMVTLRYRH